MRREGFAVHHMKPDESLPKYEFYLKIADFIYKKGVYSYGDQPLNGYYLGFRRRQSFTLLYFGVGLCLVG